MRDRGAEMTCTNIRVRRDVLTAMKRLAELKRQQHGGRASVSGVLSDLTVAELARVEARRQKKADADA